MARAEFDIGTIVEQIAHEATETLDDFIFTTVSTFCNTVTQRKIPKRMLACALIEYRTNHPEDFERMVSDYEEELENS